MSWPSRHGDTDASCSLLLTSIFSAGNTYTYAAVRSLYGLSLEGRAPKFLSYCTNRGVPVWCFCVVMCFPFLSLLQVSASSANVLNWLVSLITAGGEFVVSTAQVWMLILVYQVSLTTSACRSLSFASTLPAKRKGWTARHW